MTLASQRQLSRAICSVPEHDCTDRNGSCLDRYARGFPECSEREKGHYDVSQKTIHNVVNQKTWRHVH